MTNANQQNVQFVNFDGAIGPANVPEEFQGRTPIERTPTPDSFLIDQYKTYYYSGGQAQIYMEDMFMDEIASLTFTTVTNRSPIYGYASERFGTVAKGNLLVQGSFTINFITTGYLQIMSQAVREGNGTAKDDEFEKYLWLNGTQFRDLSGASPFETTQALNQIRGLGNKEFRTLAKRMRERRAESGEGDLPQFYSLPPFDIYAVFGDINDPSANSTVRQIKDVYLTGQSQVISTSGEAIMEQYTFIARDIE